MENLFFIWTVIFQQRKRNNFEINFCINICSFGWESLIKNLLDFRTLKFKESLWNSRKLKLMEDIDPPYYRILQDVHLRSLCLENLEYKRYFKLSKIFTVKTENIQG